jgi:arsenate reductase
VSVWGCMEKEACPTLFIHNLTERGIEDPKGKPIGFAEMLRGLLEVKISKHKKTLLKSNLQRFIG